MVQTFSGTLDELLSDLATELKDLSDNGRVLRMVGFTGAPGVGKSEAVTRLTQLLNGYIRGTQPLLAGIIPMDGFHKSNEVLQAEGLSEYKGRPDTFDVVGYLMALDRAHDAKTVVYVPGYDRQLGQAVAARYKVEREGVVLTEGNYLALQDGAWSLVREAIDLLIYLDVPPEVTQTRLVARHTQHGRTPEQALAWVRRVDEPNRLLVQSSKARADRVWNLSE
ncbi:fructose transporter [Mobiluncus curtisii]|uniref:fructose transporter n=1 Tax=Mobiluncus curtisii TaxID=2051 RepID=UPI0014708328|nr:fructose transporter [Mobiluncus curtisii]MCV0020236.1 fructose transporter [Mobiluncus curtisii]NMW46546.1 fructose transporter [Mobiluncus curtisii]